MCFMTIFFPTGMIRFMIVFHYGGNWVDSKYVGGQSKTMLVSDKVMYQELVTELHHRSGIPDD